MHFIKYMLAISALCMALSVFPQDRARKKILYINSYHSGYPASDATRDAIEGVLEGTGVELRVIEMDTKRNPGKAFIRLAVENANAAIEDFRPDLVIASDDNAVKYLLMPFYRNADLPFVFCCVNWDASGYGLPYENATGMVEVALVPEILRHLGKYARGERVGFLGGDRLSERKNRKHYEDRFHIGFEKTYFAKTFPEWKEAFLRLQDEVDMLMLTTHAGIPDWDEDEARAFVEASIKIPVGTEHYWEMPLALVGVAKDFREMGAWSARTALRILDGTPPDAIPVTANKNGQLYFNSRLARKLRISEVPPLAVVVE